MRKMLAASCLMILLSGCNPHPWLDKFFPKHDRLDISHQIFCERFDPKTDTTHCGD